ncbi:hypothetical protein BDN72DRAFT_390150 [Pluteus cervinus]|uniref:Uncharacterized protein n=1 Tax=Pluteus cervinus TaxID=181527 RepID=A0ACD3B244_9AGAR|nr:hypothetical protein BDN72DRAFT_390150 [Pluteus cervinus]
MTQDDNLCTSRLSLCIVDVRIPASSQTNRRLRLEIADGDSNHPSVKPHQVYQVKLPKNENVIGSETVLPINKPISIQGTHLILEIVQLHIFRQNKPIAKPVVLLLDVLCALKQSDQEVVMYVTVNDKVKLNIKKESLGAILQQSVLPQDLIESLNKAKLAIAILVRIGGPLSQV